MVVSIFNDYEMILDDFQEQGSRIIMRKRRKLSAFIPMAFIVVPAFAILTGKDFVKYQIHLAAVLVCTMVLFIFKYLTSIHTESLLIISSIGITIMQSSYCGTKSRFYDIHQIKDVVIIEAITMYKIIFQMVLLPKKHLDPSSLQNSESFETSDKSEEKLHPLFQNFRPKLEDLKTIYTHIQKKLILPSLQGKQSDR